MKKYLVKPEYINNWFIDPVSPENAVVNENELQRLAYEWEIPVADLLRQVYEIDNGEFAAAVELMDDDIRESVHSDLAPCSDSEFLAEYKRRHLEKYGKEFTI